MPLYVTLVVSVLPCFNSPEFYQSYFSIHRAENSFLYCFLVSEFIDFILIFVIMIK